ncbi:MAG: DM13 domain-containing protein [Acidimicrobiia bacterium]
MSPRRWLLIGAVVVVTTVGFLLFRPDTLFTDIEVDESLDEAFATATTAELADSPSTTIDEPATTVTGASNEPAQILTGQFIGVDHSAEGTAAIYEQDGRYVLRFEDDTNIQNGPDLYVWVLPSDSYEGGTPSDYIDLGTLKGTIGGQNYELPNEFDPQLHRSVLIWCLRFAVPFASAPLG